MTNPRPTASVLILKKANVLLVKRAVVPFLGYWDVPGGFIEPGETPEAAARREIREELGVGVRLSKLLGIFPDIYGDKEIPTLNIYYIGYLIDSESNITPKDDVETHRWFPLTRLPRNIAFRNNRDALRLVRKELSRV